MNTAFRREFREQIGGLMKHLGGVGIPWGCFRNYFRTAEQFPENDIIRSLQTEQVKRLTMREGIWR